MTDLRFGDMDGDGITDVVSRSGGTLAFSSAARQPWSSLGVVLPTMDGIFVADLDGDGFADAFKYGLELTGSPRWTLDVSARGRSTFVSYPTTGPHVALGRFEGDRRAERITWNDHLLEVTTDPGTAPRLISRQDMR